MLNGKQRLVNEISSQTRYNCGFDGMKQPIRMRINVMRPPLGVVMKVQRGHDELLPPIVTSGDSIAFEFDILVDVSDGRPNFLGPFAQGPKDSRFVYVNSGTYAGQNETCWARRAKISLMQIDKEQILEILNDPTSRLETSFAGTGSDGGPTCASVKGIEWKVTR